MKKMIYIVLWLCFMSQVLSADIIVTKNKKKYNGKVIKIIDRGFVVRTVEGSVIVLPKQNISKIFRGNKVLDFEEGMSYYLEVRRPFLPLAILGVASGIYSINQFDKYSKKRKEYNTIEDINQADYLKKSREHFAIGVVSALVSVGSFYVALKPMEVRIPIGRLKLSAKPYSAMLSIHF